MQKKSVRTTSGSKCCSSIYDCMYPRRQNYRSDKKDTLSEFKFGVKPPRRNPSLKALVVCGFALCGNFSGTQPVGGRALLQLDCIVPRSLKCRTLRIAGIMQRVQKVIIIHALQSDGREADD